MNHYETLGVAADADAGTIRRAYLDKARTHHPDFHSDATRSVQAEHARQMQILNEAWEVLGDPDRKAGYDLSVRRPHTPPTERIRPAHRSMPAGKGWTPRRGDTGWMDDHASWRSEDERLPEDEPATGARRGFATVPPLLVALAAVTGFVGVVLEARPMLAIAFIAFIIAVGLFILLPMFEMSRSRGRR